MLSFPVGKYNWMRGAADLGVPSVVPKVLLWGAWEGWQQKRSNQMTRRQAQKRPNATWIYVDHNVGSAVILDALH